MTADVDVVETAKAAEFFKSDGVILTGASTGEVTDLQALQAVKAKVKIPVLVGSGVTVDNVTEYLDVADALIIGSYFKKNGAWEKTVEAERVAALMKKVNAVRR